MSLASEAFTENVIAFCEWAEGKKHSLLEARQRILALMSSIPHLESFRGAIESDEEHERRGHEGWKEDCERLSDLPFQYYNTIFDPHDFEEKEKAIVGDLSDDLSDIYGDLFHGLSAYKKGSKREAIGIWVDSYFYHWGHHASQALWAIDQFYRNNQGSEPVATGQRR
ncbi:DUF5063 domain-containing protein [Cerasicoccus arenae]